MSCKILIDTGASVSITDIPGLPLTSKFTTLTGLGGASMKAYLTKPLLIETEERFWMGRFYYAPKQAEGTIMGIDML